MNVYIRELSRNLAARGVEVDIFTRRADPEQPPVIEADPGVRVLALEAGPVAPVPKDRLFCHLPAFVSELAYQILREGRTYELVHAHYWLSGWAGFLLKRYLDLPLVQMFHTLGDLKNALSARGAVEPVLRLQVERGIVQVADAVIAANPDEREVIVWDLQADPARICTVPPGVDLEHFRPGDRFEARNRLGLPDRPLVLFVGRIDPVKGIDTLFEAWRRLLDALGPDEPPPVLVFLGGRRADSTSGADFDPPLRQVVGDAQRLGIAPTVLFQGSQPRELLPLFYTAADLCVMPSRYESFGLVAVESMACGTPVVASRVGGLRYTVEHEVSGLLVPPDAPAELAAAILRGLTDHGLRSRMQVGARQAAVRYSWYGVTNAVQKVYAQVAQRSPLLPCP
jgi:D-inositol-3-phosphate glycosyltransferase